MENTSKNTKLTQTQTLLPIAALLFCAFVGGTGWLPFHALQERGLHPLWTLALVYLIALIALAPRINRPAAMSHSTPLRRVLSTPTLWALGAAFGTMNAAFFWSVSIGDVVRAVLLFNLMPVWAAVLAWYLLREPISQRSAASIALALAGAGLVLWPADRAFEGWASLPWPRDGADWLALVGGMAFALNNVLLRRDIEESQTTQVLAMFGGAAAISGAVALLLFAAGRLQGIPAPSAGWLAILAALSLWFLAGNFSLQYGASRLPPNTTSVTMLSEIIFAASSAVLLGASRPTIALGVGGLLIMAAAWLSATAPDSTAQDQTVIQP